MIKNMISVFAVANISMLMERGTCFDHSYSYLGLQRYAKSIIMISPWVSDPTFLLSAVTVKQLTRQLTDYSLGKDFRWDTSTQDYIKMV